MQTNHKILITITTFLLTPVFLSGCFLEHFTEPDSKALKEIAKYEKDQSPCSRGTGVCYAKKSTKAKRFKLNEEYYLQQLENSNDALRTQTVTEVAEIGLSNSKIISKLDHLAIHDSSKWVRRASVKALAKLQGSDAIPTLSRAEKDKDPWVRHSATSAKAKLKK